MSWNKSLQQLILSEYNIKSYLGKEIQGRQEADKTKKSIDERNAMKTFAVDDLHGAVVAAIQSQIEEENCQEIVGGPRGAGDTEHQAEDDVDGCYHNQTNQPGLGFGLHTLRAVWLDEPVLDLLNEDLGHHEENFVIIFHNSDVVGVDWDDNYNNDVNLKDKGKNFAKIIWIFTKQKSAQKPGPL